MHEPHCPDSCFAQIEFIEQCELLHSSPNRLFHHWLPFVSYHIISTRLLSTPQSPPLPLCCAALPAIVSSPRTFDAAINNPPWKAPSPRIDSACTLVILRRFSRSARFADSCASCAWRCDCFGVSFEPKGIQRSREILSRQRS